MAQQHASLSSQAAHGQGTNTYLVSSPVTFSGGHRPARDPGSCCGAVAVS